MISDLLVKAFLGEYELELETMNDRVFSDPCARNFVKYNYSSCKQAFGTRHRVHACRPTSVVL